MSYWEDFEKELEAAMHKATERYRTHFQALYAKAPVYRVIQLGSKYARAGDPPTVGVIKPFPGDEWVKTVSRVFWGEGPIIVCREADPDGQ